MKKTLAMLLSLAMVLSFMVGMFALSASAETDTATAKAEAAWAKATKTTAVTVDGVELKNGETKNLAELNAEIFTGGTIALQDGVLTVTNAAFAEEKVSVVKAVDGGLSVKLMGADWKGSFRANDAKAINTPLLLTSDGHDLIGAGNALRSCSDLIVYGNVGLKIDAGATGYDALIIDTNAPDSSRPEMVLGGTRPMEMLAAGNGPTAESRRGSIIICGNADVTIKNTNETAANQNARALAITAAAVGEDACISVIEDANLTIETAMGAALSNDAKNVTGDAILVNTTGKLVVTATKKNCPGWNSYSNLIYAQSGLVHFTKGDVLLNQTMETWTGGANSLVNANNAGGAAANSLDESIVIDGTANVVGYHKSNVTADAGYRMASFWTNGGIMVVGGDANLTVYTDNAGAPKVAWHEYMVFNAKVGGFHVRDNAKVFINGAAATAEGNCYIRFQDNNFTVPNFENLKRLVGKCGLQVSGGQLFINFPDACYGVNANDMCAELEKDGAKANMQSSFSFTGGVVVLKNNNAGKKSLIGSDPTDAAKFGVVSGEVFCSKNDRMGSVWYYFGENAPVSAFDNIDALGLSLTKGDAAPFSADGKTFTVPVEGNFKAEGTDAKLNGTAVTSGNKVVTAKANDKITASADLVVAMTKDAPTGAGETPTEEEVKVENPAAEVVITKADGSTVALNKDNKTTDGATYDPETGKLTIEGLNAKKITAASGDVIVELKGTNTLTNDEDVTAETADNPKADDGKATLRVPGKLFFVGDGKLTVTAKGYNIYSETAITFTDSVNVEVVSSGNVANAAPIYTPINSKSDDCVITFSGKAKVTGTTENGPVIRQGASPWAFGKLILKDEAELNMTVKQCASWSAAAFATHWEISGGTMNVDVTGQDNVQAVSGIEVYAEKTTREDRAATLEMTGGTVNIKVLAPITSNAGRPHGIFGLYASEMKFAGGTVNLDVKAANTPTNSGAICIQWNNDADQQKEDEYAKITVSGDAEINAKDCNSDGLFAASNKQTKVAIVIDGGTIKGSDNTFVYDRVGKSTLEIKGGTIDWTSKVINIKGAKATASVKFKEGGVGAEDKVIKTGTNPGTSDLAVALVSVIAVTSVVAAAAVLFVRKRRYN